MNLMKYFLALSFIGFLLSTDVQANGEIVSLPTFKVMAESELRAESGIIPYQQDENIRKALQHRMMQLQDDTQSFVVDPTLVHNLDVLAPAATPDLGSLPPLLREHILNIAAGLQSSDPTEGLYIMLQPFGIDRNAKNVQIVREQISIGQVDYNFIQGNQPNTQVPRVPNTK